MLSLAEFFLLPLRGVIAVVDHIYAHVWNELNDEESLKRQLLELRLQYEMNEIDDPTYDALEAELLRRLREVRERQLQEAGWDV